MKNVSESFLSAPESVIARVVDVLQGASRRLTTPQPPFLTSRHGLCGGSTTSAGSSGRPKADRRQGPEALREWPKAKLQLIRRTL